MSSALWAAPILTNRAFVGGGSDAASYAGAKGQALGRIGVEGPSVSETKDTEEKDHSDDDEDDDDDNDDDNDNDAAAAGGDQSTEPDNDEGEGRGFGGGRFGTNIGIPASALEPVAGEGATEGLDGQDDK